MCVATNKRTNNQSMKGEMGKRGTERGNGETWVNGCDARGAHRKTQNQQQKTQR